ncbi:hypothetical protein LG200_13980, partial [Methylobacillus caricis]|uniref:hypothetical protein n=1 Tax=Methylobacillus caricis TaxID=1971611 RepID=UPI001CFFDCA4
GALYRPYLLGQVSFEIIYYQLLHQLRLPHLSQRAAHFTVSFEPVKLFLKLISNRLTALRFLKRAAHFTDLF